MAKTEKNGELNNGLTEEQIAAQLLAEQAQQQEETDETQESDESDDVDDSVEDTDDENTFNDDESSLDDDEDEDIFEKSTRKERTDIKSKFKGYAFELFPDSDYIATTKNKDANACIYFKDPNDEEKGRLVVMSNNVNELFRDKKISIEQVLCLPINIVSWQMPKRNDKGEPIIDKHTGKPVMMWAKSWRFAAPATTWKQMKDNTRKEAMDENEYEELS